MICLCNSPCIRIPNEIFAKRPKMVIKEVIRSPVIRDGIIIVSALTVIRSSHSSNLRNVIKIKYAHGTQSPILLYQKSEVARRKRRRPTGMAHFKKVGDAYISTYP
jgi:hypothetical protein